MTPFAAFAWGAAGSLAVEIVTAYHAITANDGNLPKRYAKLPFLLVRGLLAIIAGGLAVAYGIQQPLLALNVGAATPLIIKTLADTAPTPSHVSPAAKPQDTIAPPLPSPALPDPARPPHSDGEPTTGAT